MYSFALISLFVPLEMSYYFNVIGQAIRQGSTINVLYLALFDLAIIGLGIFILSQILRKANSPTIVSDMDSGT
jgi:hypothetical protein